MLSDPDRIVPQIIAAVIVLFLNALAAVSEAALDSTSKSRVKQLSEHVSGKKPGYLMCLLEKPADYKCTNRLISYALLTAGIICVWTIPGNTFRISVVWEIIYAACAVAFSYIVPVKIARQHSESIALSFAGLQMFMNRLLLPLTLLLRGASALFLILFRQNITSNENEFSEDDVMSMLEEGEQSGAIKEEGRKMIGSIFRFDDEQAYEIMTPRTDVFLIDISDPAEEYMDRLMEMRYSRIPVCKDEPDNIIGILHVKDFMVKAWEYGFDGVDIGKILRKPYFVPETKNISTLFMELQAERQHITVLIDEYGGFSGIVTMEDIIEEIVGEIDDEYDQEENRISCINENTYLVSGNVPLDDLNEEIGTDLESDQSETIGGFLIDLIGEIPQDGYINQTIECGRYTFTILSVKERRIVKVKIMIKEEDNHE